MNFVHHTTCYGLSIEGDNTKQLFPKDCRVKTLAKEFLFGYDIVFIGLYILWIGRKTLSMIERNENQSNLYDLILVIVYIVLSYLVYEIVFELYQMISYASLVTSIRFMVWILTLLFATYQLGGAKSIIYKGMMVGLSIIIASIAFLGNLYMVFNNNSDYVSVGFSTLTSVMIFIVMTFFITLCLLKIRGEKLSRFLVSLLLIKLIELLMLVFQIRWVG